ncbi:MAG: large conductance mechanosensitive channel protein MscL [Hyphomicrobiales bacterium]
MLKEFKEFAMKGNMLDMAIGIVLGATFGTIVKSLVSDIFMPIIGYFFGGVDFSNLFITLGDGKFDNLKAAQDAGAATVNYGLFINAVIAFLIVAWILFMVVKAMNAARREEETAEEEAPAEPAEDIALLTEIRDLLKKKK